MILSEQTNISNKIIEHLKSRKNKKDDYDSLVIAIYESELQNLADQINKNLSELISKGVIREYKNSEGKKFIELIKN